MVCVFFMEEEAEEAAKEREREEPAHGNVVVNEGTNVCPGALCHGLH